MDGALPPVDAGSWLDFQRRRAEQAARQRIAAAGATAGDWIGRATSTLDGLVPDWTPPPPPAPPPPPEPPPLPAPSPLAGVGDWAQGALARIGQIGGDLGGEVGRGFAGAQAAPLPTLDTPSAFEPSTPFEQAGALASRVPRAAVAPVQDVIGRIQKGSAGASGALQGLGVPEGVADVAGFGAGVLNTPGAISGSSLEQAATRAGVPGAELQGDVAETLTPFPGTRLGGLTRLRTAGLVAGPTVGAAVGAATAPEDDRFGGAVRGAATGLTLGPDVADLVGGAARVARKAPTLLEGAVDALGSVPYRFGQAARREYGDVARIVPADVARALPGGVRLPDDDGLRTAVRNTRGAYLTEDGLELDLRRFQKPDQAGEAVARGGVFYAPPEQAAGYRRPLGSFVGGPEEVEGTTVLKRPLLVSEGSTAPLIAAYDRLEGKGAFAALRKEFGDALPFPENATPRDVHSEEQLRRVVTDMLRRHDAPPEAVEPIVAAAKGHGTMLERRWQAEVGVAETITAARARELGHDSIVSYDPKGFVEQVLDLREATYPTVAGGYSLRPEFRPSTPGGDALGIRSGQRFRMPRLTPEQQLQREADGAAEQRVFDAITRLWRRGPEGEAAADDLRFLAVGKGEEGERAAREYLAAKGLEDVLPAGVVPEGAAAGDDLLGLARRATEPFLARAAQTTGERAFDLAAGTAGGVAGAATADEDATWQERAGRFALGSAAGALGGANLRQLGRVASGALGDDVLGAAAGAAGSGTPPPAGGLTKLGAATQIAQATPLASLPSLGWNAVGGVARTAERFLQDTAGNLDRPDSAVADLAGMGAAFPKALAAMKREFLNLSPQSTAIQGVVPGGLTDSTALWARVLTSGTRANAATDQFFRTLNEGGARARAGARGRAAAEADAAATKAGDFASFLGANSPVADALVGAGRWANDRSLPLPKRLFGAAVAGFAPYVRTPERILAASGKLATDWGTQPVAFLRALKRGDELAMRDAGGRFAVSAAMTAWFVNDYLSGELRGDPPANPTERRRQEAQGARWNTWRGVPIGRLGPVGGAASSVATAVAAGERALLRGEHPADVGRDVVNAMGRWALSNSYLEDLQQFSEDVASGRLAQAAEKQGANLLTRPLSPLTSLAGAFDETERAREGTGEELLYKLPGGRFLLPERIDPATGEPVRRRGNPASRYAGFAPGTEPSPEGLELNRYGITAPEYRAGKDYQGAPLTGPQARLVQRASGSEINKATRETLASPEYRAADEAGKEQLLRAALTRARERADLVAGNQVGRGPTQQARREYDALPKYRGVSGSEDEIRRKNDDISRAKSARSAAKRKGRQAEADWIKAHPDQYALSRYEGVDPDRLKAQREALEKKYGVELS